MKIFSLLVFITLFNVANAQYKLKKGQQITIDNTSTGEINMGMGMTMQNNNRTEMTLDVTDEKENVYTINAKLTKTKISMDMMGQSTTYDSENPADKDSELGKNITPYLNTPVVYIMNKITGKAVRETPDTLMAAGPMGGLMEMTGDQGGKFIGEGFLVIDNDRKKLGTWITSDSTKESKTQTTYTIEAVKGNDAAVKFESTTTASTVTEQQGMQVTVNMVTKSKGLINSDIKTSLVSKRTADTEITGSFEVMGQSSDISGKINSVTTYQTK